MSNNELHEKDYLDSLNHEPAEPLIKVSRVMEILEEVDELYQANEESIVNKNNCPFENGYSSAIIDVKNILDDHIYQDGKKVIEVQRITELEAKLAKATELLRDVKQYLHGGLNLDAIRIIKQSGLLTPKSAEEAS